MTTQSAFDGLAIVAHDPDSICCATDDDPSAIPPPPPKRMSAPRQQGELPDLASLQMIISEPGMACPIQHPEQEGAQGGRVEGVAVPPATEKDAPNQDVNGATSGPRYRPAYELADGTQERLGRSTQPPVLRAK